MLPTRPARAAGLVPVLLFALLVVSVPAAAAAPAWVEDVGLLRSLGGYDAVVEDVAWSDGSRQHAAYMARNQVMTHEQDPSSPGATAAGAAAGRSGNVAYGYATSRAVLLGWLGSAGHAYWLLNPAAERFGFGHAEDAGGTDWWTLQVFDPAGGVDQGVPSSGGTLWPAEGAAVPAFSSSLHKYDDCAGAPDRGGVAAYWRSRTAPSDAVMTVDGRPVPSCTFTYSGQWHGVAAHAEVPPGARVTVELLGPDMPGPRTFTVASSFAEAGVGVDDVWPSPEARPIATACADLPSAAPFTDVAGTLFADTIRCVGGHGLAEGFPDGTFRPTQRLTRGQTFAFVARLLEGVGVPRPAASPDAFGDDDGTLFEDDIDWLAELGVLPRGGGVDPAGPMRRGLMAALVQGAARVAGAPTPEGTTDWFGDDDGHPHERAIGWVADEGIVVGVRAGTFQPDGVLTRGQMATFLARTLALLEG